MKKYLKNLSAGDLYFTALGGCIGSLIAAWIGIAEIYQACWFTLIGMVFGAYMLARKRINNSDKMK